jgi:hypothetical protein
MHHDRRVDLLSRAPQGVWGAMSTRAGNELVPPAADDSDHPASAAAQQRTSPKRS